MAAIRQSEYDYKNKMQFVIGFKSFFGYNERAFHLQKKGGTPHVILTEREGARSG
jgi:hypothetical protein